MNVATLPWRQDPHFAARGNDKGQDMGKGKGKGEQGKQGVDAAPVCAHVCVLQMFLS